LGGRRASPEGYGPKSKYKGSQERGKEGRRQEAGPNMQGSVRLVFP